MSEMVEVGGARVEVTPIEELNPADAMTAIMINGRLMGARTRGDPRAAQQAISELIEVCTEDGITADGAQELDPETLRAVLDVMISDSVMATGDTDG